MYNIIVFFHAIERFGFIYLPMHKQYTVCILCGYRDYPKIRVHTLVSSCFPARARVPRVSISIKNPKTLSHYPS